MPCIQGIERDLHIVNDLMAYLQHTLIIVLKNIQYISLRPANNTTILETEVKGGGKTKGSHRSPEDVIYYKAASPDI